jgi:hypothetical protein
MGTDLLSCREGSSVEQRWLLVSPIRVKPRKIGEKSRGGRKAETFGGNQYEFWS